jgi:hypothetical protein
MLDYKTGPSGVESSDSFTIKSRNLMFGVGFYFN